jgi:hypothetical protein
MQLKSKRYLLVLPVEKDTISLSFATVYMILSDKLVSTVRSVLRFEMKDIYRAILLFIQ